MKDVQKEADKQGRVANPFDLQTLPDLLDMGWWEADIERNRFSCSAYTAGLLGFESESIDIEFFYKMIREDYRARVIASISLATKTQASQQIFPVYVANQTVWVCARFKRKDDGYKIAGMIHTVDDQETHISEVASHDTVKNLIYQLNGIATSLLAFMKGEKLDDMVNHILASLVTHFSAERAYIFEYYWETATQSCTYEAVSRPGLEEIENLTNMPCDADTWWNQQVLAQRPIILNTLDDLPDWDVYDREILESQDIKSLMVVPFINQDNTIWGYAGIDIVDRQRNWSDEDFQWFSSLMHIINICIELSKSKAQIQEDKEYLQNLYKYMPIGYLPSKIIYDENGVPVDFVYTEANKEIERITGRPASDIVGMLGSQSNSFHDLPLMVDVVNTKKYVDFDMTLQPYNKHCRIIKFSLRKDEVISLVLDVTDATNTHKALEENEKLLRTIYANLPVGFELFSREGKLVQTNEKALEILGLSEPTSDDVLNIFDHPMIPADVKRKMKRGETVDFNLIYDLNKIRDFYQLDEPDKPLQNLTLKIAPIFDGRQEVVYYLLLIINNTETTNAYLKIQEFEEYFSLIANLAKVGYFKWNLTTNEGFGISQWFINLGKPATSQMTENLEDIYGNLYPEDFNAIAQFYAAATAGEAHSFERELRVMDGEGHIQWLRCTLIARKEKMSNDIELIGVSYDITELKEMILAKDKAEALDRLKSAFLANMSHEIRTPLNSIIGFSDLLAETNDEDERKEFIAIIQRNNELLLKLVSDILDLSKIESGTFDFVRREINTHTICEEVMQTFRNKELPEGVELQFDHDLPEQVMFADPGRVKQVLMNFITNSLKFTHQGYVRLGYELKPDDTMLFFVEDTGTGIAPENIEKIFDRFVKLDSFVQGTGLGLSICKSLIEEMGGVIGVSSEEGKGSRFWFTLPLCLELAGQE
ncbi:ATP-binding protein [Parabacteroides sp. PF5-6]|uniref:ATP-binding protein n=1 Tax=Parabacteroides sp. PF5-6 TaxID=1742403 RepID=UPI00240703C3|nr:ATP-binding protein [Parabacteroides sp. PF5-6]MDF9830040.1 signal transduction histidine kinase [Parabacteroides sp. PF5-6]